MRSWSFLEVFSRPHASPFLHCYYCKSNSKFSYSNFIHLVLFSRIRHDLYFVRWQLQLYPHTEQKIFCQSQRRRFGNRLVHLGRCFHKFVLHRFVLVERYLVPSLVLFKKYIGCFGQTCLLLEEKVGDCMNLRASTLCDVIPCTLWQRRQVHCRLKKRSARDQKELSETGSYCWCTCSVPAKPSEEPRTYSIWTCKLSLV